MTTPEYDPGKVPLYDWNVQLCETDKHPKVIKVKNVPGPILALSRATDGLTNHEHKRIEKVVITRIKDRRKQ